MFWLVDIFPAIVLQMFSHLFNPLFWLVLLLIAFQYRRMLKIRQSFFGVKNGNWLPDLVQATGYGLVGGFIGSLLMVFVGLTLSGSGLNYIWPVALLLLLIDARFLCFAYAGGIVAFSSLVFGWPQVSVPQVLALVAILHMVESVLIYFSGHLGAVPAYIKIGPDQVVGGYVLQRFWPIPVVALLIVGQTTAVHAGVAMPDWWPLIKPELEVADPDTLLYALFPVMAGLGYGDLVTARRPQEKAHISAKYLFIYSVVLLLLAVLAGKYFAVAVIAALFSPLGHEALIHVGQRMELQDKPIYVPPSHGVKVLDVIPKTAAWRIGLRSGDVIIGINDMPLFNKAALDYLLRYTAGFVEVSYISGQQQSYRRELVKLTDSEFFGVIPVPDPHEKCHMDITTEGPVIRWLKKRFKW
ncbi:PDZ domain-containing protein [Peptococcaceae bacterium 1198_IL3148]